jgi:hypothetical protein
MYDIFDHPSDNPRARRRGPGRRDGFRGGADGFGWDAPNAARQGGRPSGRDTRRGWDHSDSPEQWAGRHADPERTALRQSVMGLIGAARQLHTAPTEQRNAGRAILDDARRALYRVLGAEPEAAPAEGSSAE